MRHGDKTNNLGRTASHRKAMLSNMTCSLIAHKRIITTLAKAKALRVFAEPLITRSKVDNTHNRRIVFSYLQDKMAIQELFGVVGDKVANRPGGYTRIIKMPRRLGDAADMALVELVDFNDTYNPKEGATKKTRRSRRGTGTAAKPAAAEQAPTALDTDARATAEAAHEAAETDIAADEATTETVIPSTDDSGNAPEATAQKEGGEAAGA
jgi:large subunit ribosomal protein L17